MAFWPRTPSLRRRVRMRGSRSSGRWRRQMRAMGSKTSAREIARRAGVPVVPGSDVPFEVTATDGELSRVAQAVGYPLLVKAVAGGGGKGMRVCALRPTISVKPSDWRARSLCRRLAMAGCISSGNSSGRGTLKCSCSAIGTGRCGVHRARMLDPAASPEAD